jgi:hypothetical protein
VLTWSNKAAAGADPTWYIVAGDLVSGRTFLPRRAFLTDYRERLVGWLGDRVLASHEWVGPATAGERRQGITPALLDLQSGTMSPIQEIRDDLIGAIPIIATVGPFLRVRTPGDCLNIRATAGLEAPVITCAADGVLLVDREDSWERDGMTWLAVRTLSSDAGWGSAEFLVR